MFQFLVSGSGWEPDHDSFDRTRVFEHTDSSLVARFKPNDVLDIKALLDIPALFASEGTSSSTPLARVGRITRIKPGSRLYEIDYIVDPEIHGIPNSTLDSLSRELSIDHWEFSRTHWAVKDVDLFQILLKHEAVPRIAPKLFKLSDESIDEDSVAVMMPFAAEFNSVYQALRLASKQVRMTCTRADDIWKDDVIIQDVVNLIGCSRVVICDLRRL